MRGKKKDANQGEIVEVLEKSGFATEDMSHVGNGFPDLLVAYRNVMKLVEVKNRKTSYGRKGLNERQRRLHQRFTVSVISTVDEAAEFVRVMKACKTEKEMHAVVFPRVA
jgi:hypothetical protein